MLPASLGNYSELESNFPIILFNFEQNLRNFQPLAAYLNIYPASLGNFSELESNFPIILYNFELNLNNFHAIACFYIIQQSWEIFHN